MASSLIENGNEQVRGAVENFRGVVPTCRAGDMTFNPHDLLKSLKTTQCCADLREYIQGGQPGGSITFRFGKFSADPPDVA
jgi:hypothetical protein